jgi:hypothetical protein
MKKINFKLIGLMVLVILTLGSCKKWIDTGINKVPDSPDDTPMFTLLASIEANMAYNTVGGTDIAMPTCIWIQQIHGVARQAASEGIYIWRDGDVNNQWNTNYSRTMIDLYTMMNKATAAKHPYYLGIAEVLMAYSLGITTDVWNDIPYAEAFQGEFNLTPKFDSQQAIYAKIKELLDDAINNQLSQNYADYPQQDVIYGGASDGPTQISLWLKAAHALRARYALHLSKINGNQAYLDALADLPAAFASNNDDMFVPFPGTPGQQNPFYQFMDQRTDAAMDSVFIENLKIRFDPRLTVFAYPIKNGDYVGAGWYYDGAADVSLPGPAFAAAGAPVQFINYAECLFIKAECEFKTGVAEGTVQQSLVDAVTASMDKWGVLNPAYMHAYDSVAKTMTGAVLFHEIMYQKYIALVYQAEAFNDWRRTDNVIGLQPNPKGSLNNIPRRFPYSTDEKAYNPNTPQGVTISDRVWWDKAPGL